MTFHGLNQTPVGYITKLNNGYNSILQLPHYIVQHCKYLAVLYSANNTGAIKGRPYSILYTSVLQILRCY